MSGPTELLILSGLMSGTEFKIWTSLSFRKLESTVHYPVAAVKEDPLVALQQALL